MQVTALSEAGASLIYVMIGLHLSLPLFCISHDAAGKDQETSDANFVRGTQFRATSSSRDYKVGTEGAIVLLPASKNPLREIAARLLVVTFEMERVMEAGGRGRAGDAGSKAHM